MNLKEARVILDKADDLRTQIKCLHKARHMLSSDYFYGFCINASAPGLKGIAPMPMEPLPIADIPEAEPIMEILRKILIEAVPKRIEELKAELAALEDE